MPFTLLVQAAVLGILAGLSRHLDTGGADDSRSDQLQSSSGDKHACKGQNACKGMGGCKTAEHACKGLNQCKGKGGCRTDGKPLP
jgi:hypothetical protein